MIAGKWTLAVLVFILAILWLDRLLLKLEERGWIYYRKRHASPGTLGGAFLAVQSMLEPGTRYVLESRQERRGHENEAAGSGDPWQGPWAACDASHYAGCIEARINKGAAFFAGDLRFNDQAVVVIRFQEPDSDGMPSHPESKDFSVFGERVVEVLQGDKESICVAVLTSPRTLRLVFYTSSRQGVESKIVGLRPRIHPHEIRLMIQADDDWSTYRLLSASMLCRKEF